MRLARRLAITTATNHRVMFFKTGGSSDYNEYRIQRASAWTDVGQAKDISDEISVTEDSSVEFEPVGTSTADQTFEYALGAYAYTITIEDQTGKVTLEEN